MKRSTDSYRHVGHRERPRYLVERRNARERRRVEAVNTAFAQLRQLIPIENRNKRVSKVKTLQKAIDYIEHLSAILGQDLQVTSEMKNINSTDNNEIQHWINQKSCNDNLEYVESID